MTISLLLIDIIFFGLYWLFIKYITNHKNVLAKPEAERRKLKNQLYGGMVIALIAGVGSQLLITNKTTGWLPWLVIGLYLLLWGIGGYFILQAYYIVVKKDFAKVKKLNGQPFISPHKFAHSIGIINLLVGLSICSFAVAILLLKIKLAAWAPFFVVIGGVRQLALSKLERDDAT